MDTQQIDEFASKIKTAGIEIPKNLTLVVSVPEAEWSSLGVPEDMLVNCAKVTYLSPFEISFLFVKESDSENIKRANELLRKS